MALDILIVDDERDIRDRNKGEHQRNHDQAGRALILFGFHQLLFRIPEKL